MSIIVERFPQCDRCFETVPDFVGSETNKQLRQGMVVNGWKRRPKGDVCPDCIDKESPEVKK